MTVTIKQKPGQYQMKVTQSENDLLWLSSLRQLIPPAGDEKTWKELSPEAVRLYILIWALDSAQVTLKKGKPFGGVTVKLLSRYYKHYNHEYGLAHDELVNKKLIKITDNPINDPPQLAVTTIIYNLPADVIEDGPNVAQKEEDLLFLRSLRQYLPPPIGSKSKWLYMSPEAFKLYLLIWSLYTAQWASKAHFPYVGIDFYGLEELSGYDWNTFLKANKDLKKRKLIDSDCTFNAELNAPEVWFKLIYSFPDDEEK